VEAAKRVQDRRTFGGPERRLPLVREQLGDAAAGGLLDQLVGVGERHRHDLGQPPAGGGLARTGQADQHRPRAHGGVRPRSARRFRYACALRRVSASESPPNFSSAASARTSATIASATTPAAGTAQTSLRWLMATAASPVSVSIVWSARGIVEMGFIAARTRSSSPVVMPPSVPPLRPDTRRIVP